MKIKNFLAFSPFEIGDIVKYKGNECEILDILAMHSCKTGKVTFKCIIEDAISPLEAHEIEAVMPDA